MEKELEDIRCVEGRELEKIGLLCVTLFLIQCFPLTLELYNAFLNDIQFDIMFL